MTDPRPDQLERATHTLADFGTRLDRNRRGLFELADVMTGLIGTMGEGGARGKNTIADPTSGQALTDDDIRRDVRALYRDIDTMHAAAVRISGHWSTYMPSRAEALRRAKAIADLSSDDEVCQSHQRAGIYHGKGDKYRGYCDWCGSWKAAHGVEPAPELVRAKDRGERITDRLIRLHMPELDIAS